MKGSLVVLGLLLATGMPVAYAGDPVNPDSAIVQTFELRIVAYQKLHKGIESKMPRLKPTPSQEEIAHYEHELARALREARKAAKQGDVFSPDVAAEFRRLIQLAMQGQGAARVHESLKSAEPVQLRLRVNDSYPSGVPMQTTPPTLLINLPPLPPELEYHLAGRELILLDVKANVVVDLVDNAVS